MTRRNPKLATLTPEEDADWVRIFCSFVNDGESDADADQYAWSELSFMYRRLRAFDGCVA